MRYRKAFFLIFSTISIASADSVIANLRSDYDTPSGAFVNGQSADGLIPDTLGTGSWTFFARDTFAPGTQTALVYDTAANAVRNANAFVLPTGWFNLPGISNTQLICCGSSEGAPAANELAIHPGDHSRAQRNLVIRWTAGSGISGPVTVNGRLSDIGATITGVELGVYNQSGTALFANTTTSGNTAIPFTFVATVGAGQYIDFVIGPGADNFYGDQSAISINITGNPVSAVPEPGTLGLLSTAVVALFAAKVRKSNRD